jgi:WbqC-like protein
VFDTPQYVRRGWINRNRILHPVQGWSYITVPVRKQPRDTPIADIRIADEGAWRRRIEAQLLHYRKDAPHFEAVLALVRECLAVQEESVSRFDVAILEKTCRFLGIPFSYRLLSEMNVKLSPIDEPGDWGLRLAEALRATEYVNARGGRDLYDAAKFASYGIGLTILNPATWQYDTPGYRFEPVQGKVWRAGARAPCDPADLSTRRLLPPDARGRRVARRKLVPGLPRPAVCSRRLLTSSLSVHLGSPTDEIERGRDRACRPGGP